MSIKYSTPNKVLEVIIDLVNYDKSKITCINDQTDITQLQLNDGTVIEGTNTISQYILQQSGKFNEWFGLNENEKTEVQQWISYASTTIKTEDKKTVVEKLNQTLSSRVFIVSNYLTLADIIIYITLFPYISLLSTEERFKVPNVTRHFDLIQNLVHEINPKITLDMVAIDLNAPIVPKEKKEVKSNDKKDKKEEKKNNKKEDKKDKKDKKEDKKDKKEDKKDKKEDKKKDKKEEKVDKKDKKDKKEDKKDKKEKKEKKESTSEETGPDPSKLDIRVGHIIEARKHEKADALYVETIDCGDGEPRTVVSGLVRYMDLDALVNKDVVVLCNLKPAAMRGIKSHAMVLCANSADGTKVELVTPPPNSKPGDRITIGTYQGEPEKQLNPKKKIFESIQPGFKTNEEKECVWIAPDNSVHKFNVNGGVCKCSTIVGGGIK